MHPIGGVKTFPSPSAFAEGLLFFKLFLRKRRIFK